MAARFRITRVGAAAMYEPDVVEVDAERCVVSVIQPTRAAVANRIPAASSVHLTFQTFAPPPNAPGHRPQWRNVRYPGVTIAHPAVFPAPASKWCGFVELLAGDQRGFWWCARCWKHHLNIPDEQRVAARFGCLNDVVVHAGWESHDESLRRQERALERQRRYDEEHARYLQRRAGWLAQFREDERRRLRSDT